MRGGGSNDEIFINFIHLLPDNKVIWYITVTEIVFEFFNYFFSLSLSLSGTSRLKVKVWNLIKCFYVISFFASTAAEAAEQLPPAREKMLKQMKQIKFYTFNLAIILRQRI